MNAYIIDGLRSAVGKAYKGGFRITRPDDLAAEIIKQLLAKYPSINPEEIDDLIVGNAVPEAEQGMQMGRWISILAGLPKSVGGMVVNRYCGSGLEAIAIASAKIHAGQAECIIAGGTESMSLVPVVGFKTALNYAISSQHPEYYLNMGLTAEEVSKKYTITRERQDEFSFHSHMKALAAQKVDKFKNEIAIVEVNENYLDENMKKKSRSWVVSHDEGPRADTSLDSLSKLKPVFASKGTVTAGNSSQTSDGAAFVLVASEGFMKRHNLNPIGQLKSYAAVGVEPTIMGIGPVAAIPKALKMAGLSLNDIHTFELNEAFAAQSLAVMDLLSLDAEKVNPNGGAIALGHPLGCSGAKLTIQILNELERQKGKFGMVSACVGGGQGVAGIIERL